MPRKSKSKLDLVLQTTPRGQIISGVGSGVGLEFIKAYFPVAKHVIRIASAYFTLKGYKLGRQYVSPNVQFNILVGKEEGINVRDTVIEEIVADLGQCETDLWETVFELVQRMKSGNFIIRDAREMNVPFHCKFYICDSKLMWHGSSNYSFKGLKQSAEQISMSKDVERIHKFSDWYDNVAQGARNLLTELIEKLEAWLNLATPFEIYLKTLFLLDNLAEHPISEGGHTPVYYQKGVIARALRQAYEYGGALIVAATGLGKTTIGAEIAARLQLSRSDRTILIAPGGVRENWERQLESRNVYFKFFNINILFNESSNDSHHQITKLEEQLKKANINTVIIIDEAHFYRNQLFKIKSKRNQKSLIYDRILPAVKAGAKIFLLTATAYSTDFLNLNSLLYLLPHRCLSRDLSNEPTAWEINCTEEFAKLKVVTIIGLPHVLTMARDRGDIDSNDRTFIQLGNERHYLPKLMRLQPIDYQLFLQPELQDAFNSSCFDQDSKFPHEYFDEETNKLWQATIDTIRKDSLSSWLSSPVAMAHSIEQNLATPSGSETRNQTERASEYTEVDENISCYQTPMHLPLQKRVNILNPILDLITSGNYQDDKLLKLQGLLEKHCLEEHQKVIIFVKRQWTACYVQNKLQEILGNTVSIGCTVEIIKSNPKLKSAIKRYVILKQFSPRSHNRKVEREYDILICTDADSVGINLQDADTIIHYDPPKGADELFQRVGRILRMTTDPERIINLYIFRPSTSQFDDSTSLRNEIGERFDRLYRRHNKSKDILGSEVIAAEHSDVSLEREIDVEQLTRNDSFLGNIGGLAADTVLSHISVLDRFQIEAKLLPEYLLSAKSYAESQPRMFVMLKYQEEYHPVVFNFSNNKIEQSSKSDILDLIASTKLEPRAIVQAANIEELANQVAGIWCEENNISIDKVSKICGLYLSPLNTSMNISDLLV